MVVEHGNVLSMNFAIFQSICSELEAFTSDPTKQLHCIVLKRPMCSSSGTKDNVHHGVTFSSSLCSLINGGGSSPLWTAYALPQQQQHLLQLFTAPTAPAALPPPTAVLAAVAPTALASTALPTGAAAPSAPAVAASAAAGGGADKGRPSSGVSRAAQSAFEHFKRSKKGAAALGGLSTEEQKDFRKRWLLEKEHALNAIHEKNVETLTSSTNQRTNWYTKMELAQQLGLTADQASALTSGLPRNPSRFAHLRQDREWEEYEYFIRQSDAKKENSSSMATSSKVDVEDEAVMNDIAESLGVGQGFAVGNPMLEGPALKKPRTKPAAKKAAAKPTGSAASVASGSGGPAPAGAPTQEDWESQTLDKLEASGQALLKSSREMLKQLPDFVAKKSHFTG